MVREVVLLILIVFLLVSFIAGFDRVACSGFFCLVGSFSTITSDNNMDDSVLSCSSGAERFFTLCGNKLAMIGPSGVSIFATAKEGAFSSRSGFSSPYVRDSSGCFVVCSASNGDFSICGSFTHVCGRGFRCPIAKTTFTSGKCVTMVAHRVDRESVIRMCGGGLSGGCDILSGGFTFSISVSDRTSGVTVSCCDINSNDKVARVRVHGLVGGRLICRVSVTKRLLLRDNFLSGKHFTIVASETIEVCSELFRRLRTCACSGNIVSTFSVDRRNITISCALGSEGSTVVFSGSKGLLCGRDIGSGVGNINMFRGCIFLHASSKMAHVSAGGFCSRSVSYARKGVLVCGSSAILIYKSSGTRCLGFASWVGRREETKG